MSQLIGSPWGTNGLICQGCSAIPKELFWPPMFCAHGFCGLYSPVLLVTGSGACPAIAWPHEHPSLTTSASLLQFIVISSLLDQPPLTLFDYQYPEWSISVGYLIEASSFICIPFYMVYKLVWTPGSLKQVRSRVGDPAAHARAGTGQGPPRGSAQDQGWGAGQMVDAT